MSSLCQYMYIVLCLYLVDVWWSIVVGKDSLCDLFCLDYIGGIFGLGNCNRESCCIIGGTVDYMIPVIFSTKVKKRIHLWS